MEEGLSMQGNMEINEKEGYVLVSVNPKIYPLDVVLSSAYMFTEKYYVLVDGDPREEIIVELRPKNKKENLEQIGRDFNNELINYADYTVRAIKNEELRRAILNRVLLTNTIGQPEGVTEQRKEIIQESNDCLEKEAKPWKIEDSEKILVPWEEKYGKSKNKQSKERSPC